MLLVIDTVGQHGGTLLHIQLLTCSRCSAMQPIRILPHYPQDRVLLL